MAQIHFGKPWGTSPTQLRPAQKFSRSRKQGSKSQKRTIEGSYSVALARRQNQPSTAPVDAVANGNLKTNALVFERCPMCKKRQATTDIKLGPVRTKICDECSKPVWNALGLIDWLKGL